MSFCTKCGSQLSEDATFCSICGEAVTSQYQAPVSYVPVQPQIQQVVYVKPKIPGRGFSIAGMVLGIIGLVYGLGLFSGVVQMVEAYSDWEAFSYYTSSALESVIPVILVFSVLSILAVSFGAAGRGRGYRGGVNTSGIVMGVIGLVLYVVSLFMVIGAVS